MSDLSASVPVETSQVPVEALQTPDFAVPLAPDVALVARYPDQMPAVQQSLIAWMEHKIARVLIYLPHQRPF